jgi:DUF1009 family protein
VERTLGLICGGGLLPPRMAAQARRLGWRVVAFTFDGAPDMDGQAARVVPCRLTELAPFLEALSREGVGAVVVSGRFSLASVLRVDRADADAVARGVETAAGSRQGGSLFEALVALLAGLGIQVLDQRPFLGDALPAAGCWSARSPGEAEWRDIARGLRLARSMAGEGVGQTVVLRNGVVTAVEAVEGTTEAVRRGTRLAGPGAVVVKTVTAGHDYRFDLPAVGPETLEAAAAGRAAVVAVEAGRIAILEREATVAAADAAGISLVSVDAPA